MNVATLFERSARRFPDKVAIRCAGEEMTYRELEQRANALAGFLQRNGMSSDHRLAIYLPNCPEYMVCMLAVWKVGGVALPVNYMFPKEVLRYVLEDSGSAWLVVDDSDLGQVAPVIRQSGLAKHVLVTGAESPELGYSFAAASHEGGEGFPTAPRRDGDAALLMYTSGTTGKPKGVRQTHRNNSAAIEMVVDARELGSEDHWLLAVPMFHVGGLQVSTFPALASGGTLTTLQRWSPAEWLDLAVRLRPTFSGLISTMVVDLVNHAADETPHLDSMRMCLIGGSRTPEPAIQRFREKFGVGLKELYGQTENTGLSTTYRVGEDRVPGSIGRAMEQAVEAKVVHPQSGEDLPSGDPAVGELYLRGEIITPGYWNLPEITEEKFDGEWLRTGDMVRRDEHGYLYYADRIDDMIVSGGENVYPQEVESALAQHEGIAEVAVIGTPHERWIEQVTAIVVPKDDAVTEETIAEFCAGNDALAAYQRPRRIELVEELPKTGSGKVNKAPLKEIYGQGGRS